MYRPKSVVVSAIRWLSIGHHTRYPLPRINYQHQNSHMYRTVFGIRRRSISYPPSLNRKQSYCFQDKKTLSTNMSSTKKSKESKTFNKIHSSHLNWWRGQMLKCRKPTSKHLIKSLSYSNLLGLDDNLKNGSMEEGTLNCEILKFKSKFPREVFLCRVGEFYEAVGFDACILVEYAGLIPSSALCFDGVPKVSCCIMNLRRTLDDLTHNGFSACVVEEIQAPTQAYSHKNRFISGHAHPGSPYVFGHVEDDYEIEFPEPTPVLGLSRSEKGYCIVSVLETMKTYSFHDGLPEEAVVTKLRTCHYHHLFLHKSLMNDSGTIQHTNFGEGGLLWGECNGRYFEWIGGDFVNEILCMVKELYGLDDDVTFRNVTVASEDTPHPLHLGTASQIGVIPTEGIPPLLEFLLPSDCTGLPAAYIRDLLLNPPDYATAAAIQAICKRMSNTSCPISDFTYIAPSKVVKLLEVKEANHVEFRKIKTVLDQILKLYGNSKLYAILNFLLGPTRLATGLKIDLESLVKKCRFISRKIGNVICSNGENDQKLSSYENAPSELFEVMEQSWKNRVEKIHLEEVYEEVDKAAEALSLAVTSEFLRVVCRIKASPTDFVQGAKEGILYDRERKAIFFNGKHLHNMCCSSNPGEKEIKKLQLSVDSKGREVEGGWFTTKKVQDALTRYHEANAKAKSMVLELLRGLSAELQAEINILVFASTLIVIAKALFAHVSEGIGRKWVFPALIRSQCSVCKEQVNSNREIMIHGLSPYWLDTAEGNVALDNIRMKSMSLLPGLNRGKNSRLLRSISAAALLGVCGFMVPAKLAKITHLDSIILHTRSYDNHADGKNSFQTEEIPPIIARATSRSLVLIDGMCRAATKETSIDSCLIERLYSIGCMVFVSANNDVPLTAKHIVYNGMGSGLAKGLPEKILQRAKHLYSYNSSSNRSPNQMEKLWTVVEYFVRIICDKKLNESKTTMRCVLVRPGHLPPLSAIGASSVYVIISPDKSLYVGQTYNLLDVIRASQSKRRMRNASFMYFLVPEKSIACELETLLIHQLPKHGFKVRNVANGQH